MTRKKWEPVIARVGLLLLGLTAGLLIGEFSLRSILPDFKRHYVLYPGRHEVFEPIPGVMPGVSGRTRFIVNADGIRGDELDPAHTYRILAVGGSTTECLYLDQEEAWPYRLQRLLNREFGPEHRVWVGNIGVSGRRSREHVVQLEYVLPELGNIDAVLLLLGANDIMRRLAEDESYDPNVLSRPEKREYLLDRAFALHPGSSDSGGVFRRTAIGTLIHRALARSRKQRDRSPISIQGRDGSNYLRWRKFRSSSPEIRARLPDLTTALDEYDRNIESLVRVTQENSARIILMTQPSLYSRDMPREYEELLWMGGIGRFNSEPGHVYYSVEAMAEAFEAYNAVLRKACARLSVECIDIARSIARDTTAFSDDVHFNEGGAEAVAQEIYAYLRTRPPFD